jgi:xanthine dehydrogenase YagS FAD-binding subunit
VGKLFKEETITAAAKLSVAGAKPLKHNAFKVDLVQRTIVRALLNLGDLA